MSVWIVDDDESIRWVLERACEREGLATRSFANARSCLETLATDAPRVLVCDIRMPGESGLQLLAAFRRRRPETPVIVMTAYSDLDSAVAALQGGAFEYLPKPFDVAAAVQLVRRALEQRRADPGDDDSVQTQLGLLGRAPAMQDVFRAIGRLAQSSATVLITGESGTGKELVARALHQHSPRAKGEFVAVNAAAIPGELLESELFGHERGAFTGAVQLRQGRFEQAREGTLFLDEIGDMPPEMQTRLLRVLSEGQYYRVGGHQPLKAEARVIAATHQALEERVRQGQFREDLFHRLNVIRLRLPPLRERSEDIALLARHFLQRSAQELGGATKQLSRAALRALVEYRWPGNVRELENLCRWLTLMIPARVIELRDLPAEIREPSATSGEASFVRTVARDSSGGPGVQGPSGGTGAQAATGATFGGAAPVVAAAAAGAGAAPGAAAATADDADVAPAPPHYGRVEPSADWQQLLAAEVAALLASSPADGDESLLMDRLTRDFEATVISAALRHTRGRRVEAAQRLGIGRNTITRKIGELHLDERDS
ncbi:MAG: nitrogen regulation protein NR(I) [Burkholderiaceae bacterium]|nr:nitrogen regulation protein NR(I) [Burkholderiaceae bacterium]